MINYSNLNAEQQTMVDYYLYTLYKLGENGYENKEIFYRHFAMPLMYVVFSDNDILYFRPTNIGTTVLKMKYEYFYNLCQEDKFLPQLIVSTLLYEIVPLVKEYIPFAIDTIKKTSDEKSKRMEYRKAAYKLIEIKDANGAKIDTILSELVAYINNPNVELIKK